MPFEFAKRGPNLHRNFARQGRFVAVDGMRRIITAAAPALAAIHPGERPRAFPDNSSWETHESVPRQFILGNARERSPTIHPGERPRAFSDNCGAYTFTV